MKRKGKMRRALPLLLAAALWVEGTCKTAYAAEQQATDVFEEAAFSASEIPGGNEPTETTGEETGSSGSGETDTSGGVETENSGREETPAPEGSDQTQEPEDTAGEEAKEPGETKEPGSEEPEEPEDGETPDSGKTEEPGGEPTAPEEPEKPDEEETQDPGETEAPVGEEESPVPEETVSENTVSENTAEADAETDTEIEEAFSGEPALGEPPLMSEGGAVSYGNISLMAEGQQSGKRATPSRAEIIERYKAYPWSLDVSNSYSKQPSTKSPYAAGHLSDDSLENALNLLNFIRYVAGISADVTLNEDYIELVQAGALVNCVNGQLSHEPAQPEGFPDDLYALGKEGCGSSNIASGYGSIAQSILNGWMYDGDASNIDRMGHRRWILNPAMKQTGFGAVEKFSAMYAFDRTGSTVTDYVAWPAANMPIELMNGTGTPWTVSLGSEYQKTVESKVKVTLQNLVNNKTYTFPSSTGNGGYLKVNTDYYGVPNCIIFRPNGVSYDKTSRFRVTITGLTDSGGNDTTLSYEVNFFSLEDTPSEIKKITLDQTSLRLRLEGTEEKTKAQLSATITPDDAEDKSLVWKSSNEAVATVSENSSAGLTAAVEAKGVGEAEISVTAANGVQAVCSVRVSAYSLSPDTLSFDLSADAGAKKVTVMDGDQAATDRMTWQSENENVATVDTDGAVTPVGVGETRIWVTVADAETLGCLVTVEDSGLPDLQMQETSCTLRAGKAAQGDSAEEPGETKQLKVYFTPADTKWKNSLKWHTSNQNAVVLLKDGEEVREAIGGTSVWIRAKGKGEAKIYATVVDENGNEVMRNGKKAQVFCTVKVQEEAALTDKELPVPVALTNTQATLKDVALPAGWQWQYPDTALSRFAGQRTKKFGAVYEKTGYLPTVKYLEVHFVTVERLSMGFASGQSTASVDVSRLAKGQVIESYVNYFSNETLALFEGQASALKDNVDYAAYKQSMDNSIRWSSSNPAVASIESTGNHVKVTALAAGTTTLKAQLKLGQKTFTASTKITVLDQVEGLLTVKSVASFTLMPKGSSDTEDRYGAALSVFAGSKANEENSKILLTLPEAAKVTAKSSNAKVIAVKTARAEGGGFAVPLVVKAAGTAQITLTGNDPAKTTRTITLVVDDPEPGLLEESVTVNTLASVGTALHVYAAKKQNGSFYEVSGLRMAGDEKSASFTLTAGENKKEGVQSLWLKAKSGTKTGTYRVKICAAAGGMAYELPLTVKVTAGKPNCKVKQADKLNIFYKNTTSRLDIDTAGAEIATDNGKSGVTLNGCSDYEIVLLDDGYYLRPRTGVTPTLNSVKKGTVSITLKGYSEPVTLPFTVGVEKKAPKLTWETGKVTLYPRAGINKVWVGIKNAEAGFWDSVTAEKTGKTARGNYQVAADPERQGLLLGGTNLNRAESFQMQILLKDSEKWTDSVTCKLTVKVSLKQPAITLSGKTLQLNTNDAYVGYDAASALVRWKEGGNIAPEEGVKVSVYYNTNDARAKALVTGSQAVFSVTGAQVSVRLNNRAVTPGSYKFTVQAAKDGKVWRTPLTVKIVDTAPEKAVKISAKGSIDVLNRENSFITLTPSLKAVNGSFVIHKSEDAAKDRVVELRGRDAHLFRAKWNAAGTKIELRAKRGETLVTKYQYTVTPVIELENAGGETEKIEMPAVKFQVKQGSAKVTAAPKTAQMHSGAYNSVEVNITSSLKGAPAPEIESVTLLNHTDAFRIEDFDAQTKTVTLAMAENGRAVKGKTYSLKFQVRFAEQADNGKPVTAKYTVKVK